MSFKSSIEDGEKKRFGFYGMDNIDTQEFMNDRCWKNNMNVEYTLDKDVAVPKKITKLPGL